MRLTRPLTALVGLLAAGLVACSAGAAENSRTAVATVYPLAWVVGEIAPDLELTALGSKGQDPHDLELTPGQRAAVEQASLVVYLGDIGFQPQVEGAMGDARGTVVDATEVLGEDALRRSDDGDEVDPHLWFDPALMADLAQAVGDAAVEAHPNKADEYRANAARVVGRLRSLDRDVDRLLATCRQDGVVVGHEAFAYLLEAHGLQQHGISGAAGHGEASPQDISDLAAKVRADGLPAVLSEPVEGRADADAVAREAGVDVIEVSSLDIVTPEQAEKGYPALLLQQAQAVAKAAECGAGTL